MTFTYSIQGPMDRMEAHSLPDKTTFTLRLMILVMSEHCEGTKMKMITIRYIDRGSNK